METKVWKLEELPRWAEIRVSNEAWQYEVATLDSVKEGRGYWFTESWDLIIFWWWEYEQVDNNRFNLLQEKNEQDKEVQ
jgi:hypothetical protein